MRSRILLLGRGFIGTQLARALTTDGYQVRSYASAECDLRDPERVADTLGPLDIDDTLILAAARTRSAPQDEGVYAYNVAIARSVAQFLQAHPLRQVIFLSTADVYGPPRSDKPIHEGLALNPVSPYARSKAVSEAVLQYVCSPYRTRLLILRFPGVYGPGDHGKSVVSRMFSDAQERGVITVQGTGQSQRDYLYVGDLIEVVRQALKEPRQATINVATGQSFSIKEIAAMVARKVNSNVEIREVETHARRRAYDLLFDISRLRTLFPNLPCTRLEEGIGYLAHTR